MTEEEKLRRFKRNVILGSIVAVIVVSYVAGASRGWKTRSTAGKVGKFLGDTSTNVKKSIANAGKSLKKVGN